MYIHIDLYLRIARQQSIGAQVDFIEGDEENIQVLVWSCKASILIRRTVFKYMQLKYMQLKYMQLKYMQLKYMQLNTCS